MLTASPKGKQLAAGNSHPCGCRTATGHQARRALSPCGPEKQPCRKIIHGHCISNSQADAKLPKTEMNLVLSATPSSLVFSFFRITSLLDIFNLMYLSLSKQFCRL